MSKQSITKEILRKMEHEAEMAPTFRVWKEMDKVMNRRDWFNKLGLTVVFILMLLVGVMLFSSW